MTTIFDITKETLVPGAKFRELPDNVYGFICEMSECSNYEIREITTPGEPGIIIDYMIPINKCAECITNRTGVTTKVNSKDVIKVFLTKEDFLEFIIRYAG